MPNVSIIIPLYNRAKYLDCAIQSIKNQSYADWEIVIIDDGSTDGSQNIAQKFADENAKKIRYFRQENQGPSAARNKGIKEAKGEYIAFLDADDEWLPNYLERTVHILKKNGCDWVVSSAYRVEINENEKETTRSILRAKMPDIPNELYKELLSNNIIGETSRVVALKKCLEKAGSFREDLRVREDWELWIRLAKNRFKICCLSEPLHIYKIRSNSTIRTNINSGFVAMYKIVTSYSQEAFALDSSFREIYAEKLWEIAREILLMEKRDYALFLKCVVKSQMSHPSIKRIIKSLKTMLKRKS